MNILDYLKELLIADKYIQTIVDDRVYFIRTTESSDRSKPFILIRSLNGEPSTFVSDTYLSETFFVQIDVQSFKYDISLKVANRIRKILWTNGFKQEGNEFDEYFEETNKHVLARKYIGIPKNKYYKGEPVE
jgi:hypothetical protein